jgi:hypothetical protein
MLSAESRVYHLWPPPQESALLVVPLTPSAASHTEVLTWAFPAVMRDAVLLRMQWGSISISVHIAVIPSRPPGLLPDDFTTYLGRWSLQLLHDSTHASTRQIDIFSSHSRLAIKGRLSDATHDTSFYLEPIGGHQFHPMFQRQDSSFCVDRQQTLVFQVQLGKAVSFELRGSDDGALAHAKRLRQ